MIEQRSPETMENMHALVQALTYAAGINGQNLGLSVMEVADAMINAVLGIVTRAAKPGLEATALDLVVESVKAQRDGIVRGLATPEGQAGIAAKAKEHGVAVVRPS